MNYGLTGNTYVLACRCDGCDLNGIVLQGPIKRTDLS